MFLGDDQSVSSYAGSDVIGSEASGDGPEARCVDTRRRQTLLFSLLFFLPRHNTRPPLDKRALRCTRSHAPAPTSSHQLTCALILCAYPLDTRAPRYADIYPNSLTMQGVIKLTILCLGQNCTVLPCATQRSPQPGYTGADWVAPGNMIHREHHPRTHAYAPARTQPHPSTHHCTTHTVAFSRSSLLMCAHPS
jgi:hypothetical protein